MISIRLTEEEHVVLLQKCSVAGARSLSDFARDAFRKILNGSETDYFPAGRAEGLLLEIQFLKNKMAELSSQIVSVQSQVKS